MLLPLLAALALAGHAPADSLVRVIPTAPAETLTVTIVGPDSGAPVVIIPGLVGPAFAYRRVLPELAAAGLRAIVIEPLGVGHSTHPGGNADYSLYAQATRIGAVMDSLGVRHAVVMGHAVGTAMVLRLAWLRPDLVRRVLLVEGANLETAAVGGVKQALRFAWLIKLFGGRGRVRKELRKGLVGSSVDSSWVTDSVINGYTSGTAGDLGAVLRALKGMQNSVEPESFRPRLYEIRQPVRLLLASGPRLDGGQGLGVGRIQTLQERIPHFSAETVWGTGLHMQEEKPEVLVQELIRLAHDPEPAP